MPKLSTYNPDALAILDCGGYGDGRLSWQVYSYAGGAPRVRFVRSAPGKEPRKVDHFSAADLAELAELAPAAREALLSVSAPLPTATAPDPERAQLLSEVSRLRAQLAEFAVGRSAGPVAPAPVVAPAAPAPVKASPPVAPRKAKISAPDGGPSANAINVLASVSAARAAVLS